MPADREHDEADLRRRSISVKGEPGVSAPPDRTPKACLKCRAQKMRCVGAADPPCKRCRRTGSLCEFVPRANAAHPDSPETYASAAMGDAWRHSVETRLKHLEEHNYRLQEMVDRLTRGSGGGGGWARSHEAHAGEDRLRERDGERERAWRAHRESEGEYQGGRDHDALARRAQANEHGIGDQDPFAGVHEAVDTLLRELPASIAHHEAWRRETVATLWASFCDHMPGLHFLSGQVSFSTPTPLLAASVLFMSTEHYPSDAFAPYQAVYLDAFSGAIGSLASYRSPGAAARRGNGRDTQGLSRRFDDVLGIILVGLVAIGWVDTVGLWVNAAYRLFLDGVHEDQGRRIPEWRGLWEGLRTVELEHCSLHLICPALPNTPPDPPFGNMTPLHPGATSTTAGKDIDALLLIMQKRMKRFVARGLPTPWDRVVLRRSRSPGASGGAGGAGALAEFDAEDVAELRAWAADIDAWFSIHSFRTKDATNYVRAIVLLNYHLHKIFVLSLLVPLPPSPSPSASSFGTSANISTNVNVSAELLQTARLALSIEASGFEVWSSWDLVIMTNATLFLLDAAQAGRAEPKDQDLVHYHLGMLKSTHQSAPSLRHTLAARLESALAAVGNRHGHAQGQGPSQGHGHGHGHGQEHVSPYAAGTARSGSSMTPTSADRAVPGGDAPWRSSSAQPGGPSLSHAPPHLPTSHMTYSSQRSAQATYGQPLPPSHLTQPAPHPLASGGQFEDLDRLFAPADQVWSDLGGLPMDPNMGGISSINMSVGDLEWPPFLVNMFGPTEGDQAAGFTGSGSGGGGDMSHLSEDMSMSRQGAFPM